MVKNRQKIGQQITKVFGEFVDKYLDENIAPKGLSLENQWYFFEHIRTHIPHYAD